MKREELEAIKAGTILHTSWGYDMTMNDFCVVLERTEASLKCRMIGLKTIDGDPYAPGGARVAPDLSKRYEKPFRVRIYHGKEWNGNVYYWLTGSYPYTKGDKRKGYWYPVEQREMFYENHLD